MQINLRRTAEPFQFEAENEDGFTFTLDAGTAAGGGGKGFRPMQTVLAGIGSCSVFDLVAILKKQKQPVEDITVKVDAERDRDATPSPFTAINITYQIKGAVDRKKAERAAELAVTKYCSVGASLDPAIKITWDTVITE